MIATKELIATVAILPKELLIATVAILPKELLIATKELIATVAIFPKELLIATKELIATVAILPKELTATKKLIAKKLIAMVAILPPKLLLGTSRLRIERLKLKDLAEKLSTPLTWAIHDGARSAIGAPLLCCARSTDRRPLHDRLLAAALCWRESNRRHAKKNKQRCRVACASALYKQRLARRQVRIKISNAAYLLRNGVLRASTLPWASTCRGESRMQLLPMASSPDGLISARYASSRRPEAGRCSPEPAA